MSRSCFLAALPLVFTTACSSGPATSAMDGGGLTGDPQVDVTLQTMMDRYDALLATCDHKGLFAIAYLRTTDAYKAAAEEPGFFADPSYLSAEDALFAKYYFEHIDAWTSGKKTDVPPAWQLSFQSSEEHQVDTLGDALIGISAHINQDLPYVLATLGVTDASGNSRKPDHDKVNTFLANVSFDADVQTHWDPAYSADYLSGLTLIEAWREAAWQSALKLLAAKTPAERAAVDAQIARDAETAGRAFKAITVYSMGDSSVSRDAFCKAHR